MRSKLYLFIFSLLIISVAARSQTPQKIYTLAGNGFGVFGGDGNNASAASLWGPVDVTFDRSGNVYIADHLNYRVRKIYTNGLITTIAGNGTIGYTGNGSIGSSAAVVPKAVACDASGNVYICDDAFCVIRKVNSLGIISTFAGVGLPGYSGDGSSAAAARFSAPTGMAFDAAGNLFVADMGNHVVRKISTTGIISTVAGSHVKGFAGDNGPATDAVLDSPYDVAVDIYGNLYINDFGNNIIRKVDTANIITTYAGTQGVYGFAGDNGPAINAKFDNVRGLAVDKSGNLFLSDANNNVVRKIDYATGIISIVAGNGTYGFGGDLGYATGANLFNPYGLIVDSLGSIYIADANNQRIRKTYSTTVGVAPVSSLNVIEVYPNPTASTITVTGLQPAEKVIIADAVGRIVTPVIEVNTVAPQVISIRDLIPGMYLLSVTDASGNTKTTIRLVKE